MYANMLSEENGVYKVSLAQIASRKLQDVSFELILISAELT